MIKLLVALCFFLMLLFPTMYQTPRLVYIALILGISLINKSKPLYIAPKIKTIWSITFVTSMLFIMYGFMNDCPGAMAYIGVFIIYPIFYIIVIARSSTWAFLNIIHNVLVWGGGFVMLLITIILVNEFAVHIGPIEGLAEILGFKFGVESGAMSFSSPIEDICAYLFSYLFSYIIIGGKSNGNKKPIYISLILTLMVVLLSQSRSAWLTSIATPFMIDFYLRMSGMKGKFFCGKNIVLISITIIILFVSIVNIYDVDLLTEKFLSSFDFQSDDSNLERVGQYNSLTKDFINSPIIGNGLGWASGYLRSEKPWQYELTYNYLLACVGVLGFLIYLYSVIKLFCISFQNIKSDNYYANFLIPQTVALTVIIIASETNPYLWKFDMLWTLYLPVLTNNIIYEENRNKK